MVMQNNDPKDIFNQAAAEAQKPEARAQLSQLPSFYSIKDDYKDSPLSKEMEAAANGVTEKQITIACGKGRTAYQAVMTVKLVKAPKKISDDKAIQFQQGEGLVTAILNALGSDVISIERLDMEGRRRHGANGEAGYIVFSEGKVVRKEYYNLKGELDDGPNGEAALQVSNDNGNLIFFEHYLNGVLNDGARGAAARGFLDDEGHLLIEERYRGGLLNDTFYGAAARLERNAKGQIVLKEHMKDGVLQDTKDEYARQKFSAGKIIEAESHQNGELVQTFYAAELALMSINPALRFGGPQLPKIEEEESSTTSPHNKPPAPKEPNMINPGKSDYKP